MKLQKENATHDTVVMLDGVHLQQNCQACLLTLLPLHLSYRGPESSDSITARCVCSTASPKCKTLSFACFRVPVSHLKVKCGMIRVCGAALFTSPWNKCKNLFVQYFCLRPLSSGRKIEMITICYLNAFGNVIERRIQEKNNCTSVSGKRP